MREQLVMMLDAIGLAWWVEIMTQNPRCTYYFGPFTSYQEAADAKGGYIEDLEGEGAQGISVAIKRCKPDELTVYDDLGEIFDHQASPAYG
jgi:Domain of unknown function (DUF1816)